MKEYNEVNISRPSGGIENIEKGDGYVSFDFSHFQQRFHERIEALGLTDILNHLDMNIKEMVDHVRSTIISNLHVFEKDLPSREDFVLKSAEEDNYLKKVNIDVHFLRKLNKNVYPIKGKFQHLAVGMSVIGNVKQIVMQKYPHDDFRSAGIGKSDLGKLSVMISTMIPVIFYVDRMLDLRTKKMNTSQGAKYRMVQMNPNIYNLPVEDIYQLYRTSYRLTNAKEKPPQINFYEYLTPKDQRIKKRFQEIDQNLIYVPTYM